MVDKSYLSAIKYTFSAQSNVLFRSLIVLKLLDAKKYCGIGVNEVHSICSLGVSVVLRCVLPSCGAL